MSDSQLLVKSDKDITRNKFLRLLIAFGAPVILVFLGFLSGTFIGYWFGMGSFVFIGWSAGVGAGVFVAIKSWQRSKIRNGATTAFVTIDPFASLFPSIASLLGLTTLVSYGPGEHFCFPWERRSEENVVNISEAAEAFEAVVQTSKGDLTFQGELRLRPDLERLPEFINGAAAVASDAVGLIQAFILNKYSGKNTDLLVILAETPQLNTDIENAFQKGKVEAVSDFEKRFGVIVGDATVTKIVPSDALRETFGALTESSLIDQMVATAFGYTNYADLFKKVGKKGGPTWAQVNQVRTQKMAMSGNLQGMDLKDHTFNLNLTGLDGLSPEAAQALGVGLGRFAGANNSAAKKGGTK